VFLRKLSAGLCFLVMLLAVSASSTGAQQSPEKASVTQGSDRELSSTTHGDEQSALTLQRRTRYKLCRSDVVDLHFAFTPEFNQSVTVQPDGYITLRGANSIRAEGLTLAELIQSVQKAYAATLHEPLITAELKDFEKPFFIVGGEVGRPGKYDLRGDATVVEAVTIAGGFRDSAKHSEVYLFHRVPEGWARARKIDVKKMLKSGNFDEVSYLQPGDFLYVPKSTFSKIAPFIPSTSLGAYVNPFQVK